MSTPSSATNVIADTNHHTSEVPAAAAAPSIAAANSAIMEHSNDNLLKMNTFDKYSTASALKKIIVSALPAGTTGDTSKGEPLLPGLLRMGKNPKNEHMFMAFETAEQRAEALRLLSTHLKHRKQQHWSEVAVTDRDMLLTHRGAGNTVYHQQSSASTGGGDNTNEATGELAGRPPPQEDSNRTAKKREREQDARTSSAAPWGAYPYRVQVSKKASHCRSIVRQIAVGRIQNQFGNYSATTLADNLHVIESPILSGYRNHANFTCGLDAQRRPAIGFMAGSVVDGHVAVEDVTGRYPSAEPTTGAEAVVTIPPTTHPLSVAYAKAVMSVAAAFENYTAASGISSSSSVTYHLEMNDKENQTPVKKGGLRTETEETSTTEGAAAPVAPSEVRCPFWRRVQVRHSVKGDVMVDLEVCRDGLPDDVVAAVKAALVTALSAVEQDYCQEAPQPQPTTTEAPSTSANDAVPSSSSAPAAAFPSQCVASLAEQNAHPSIVPRCRLVSLQWHFHSGSTMCPADTPRERLCGPSDTLDETLCGLTFSLSPTAFFQVNTPTTEKMLEEVARVANLKPTTTLLDLCCGTGIIGICLARYVNKIVGIEMIPEAIENAKINAARNNLPVGKTVYYAAKVEDALHLALQSLTPAEKEDMVAIFDPPRAGMHASVLRAVRGLTAIRRVVYISCDQNALLRDVPTLTKEPTKKYRGVPFTVDGAFGIDLFPHTSHVEMVAVLQRVDTSKIDMSGGGDNDDTVEGDAA